MTPRLTLRERWRAWEPSPILVKEARQSVRSRGLLVMLCLALAVLAGHGLIRLVALPANQPVREGANFFFVTLVLTGVMEAGLAWLLFWRHARENVPGQRDMLYITALRPGQIVRGKFVAAMAFTLCLFAASLPFLALAYFLRGIDLLTMCCSIATLLMLTAVWNLWGILVGVFVVPLYVKVILWLLGLGLLQCLMGCGAVALAPDSLLFSECFFLFLAVALSVFLYFMAIVALKG